MNEIEFWDNVDVGEKDECWEWRGLRYSRGYGRVWYGGKMWSTHRLAWTLANGSIPDGFCICHHCDNPSCCNVAGHLFIGTQADNMADMDTKGRRKSKGSKGESHGVSKLTSLQVLRIRERYAAGGVIYRELADEYGVHLSSISLIVRRKTWRHI